jgi:CheY-like chemotaxis protein
VDRPAGPGTTFTVWLPFQRLDDLDSGRPLEPTPAWVGWQALVADERRSFRASAGSRLVRLGLAVDEWAMTPTALAAAPLAAQPYDLLVVQDLARLTPDTLGAVIAGLHRWAHLIITLETHYDAEVAQRVQQAGVAAALWSGATGAQWQAALTALLFGGSPEPVPTAASSAEWLRTYLTGKTVLVVEDYAINRAIMTHQLQSHGLRVIEVGDGDAAVTQATQPGIDLVLMDIQMPGKDGIAAIQEIRQHPAGARLPLLGFTASADKPTYRRILDAGADRVLTKPLSEVELIAAIYQALRACAVPPVAARDRTDGVPY